MDLCSLKESVIKAKNNKSVTIIMEKMSVTHIRSD